MTALSERLRTGVHPGLPEPMTRVPFGRESASKEAVGLIESQLELVVALLAAEVVQEGPVTIRDLAGLVGGKTPFSYMRSLVRRGWVEHVGFTADAHSKTWRPTAKAWKELGFKGWSFTNGPARLEVVR